MILTIDAQKIVDENLHRFINQVFIDYGYFIATLVIGIVIGGFAKYLLSDRKYIKQLNVRISERDNQIQALYLIVHDQMKKVAVDKIDANLLNRLKRYFKRKTLKS